MLSKFVSLFKKSTPEPNLRDGWLLLHKLTENLDDTRFYLAQIKDRKPKSDEIAFATKAEFFLSSYRDEVKIALNESISNIFKGKLK